MLKTLLICVTISFALVSGAMAQTGRGACAADIKKACGNIKPGGGRIATCLKDRVTDLSDVCKARLAEVAAAGKTCRAEVQQQCGTESRRIKKLACIKNALSSLSDDCKAAVAAVAARKK